MDSSGSVGAGHLVRCLALAQELQSRGVKTFFISQNMLAPLNRFLLSSGHTVIRISQSISSGFNWERDSAETLKALKDISADILIVDHYQIDERWHKSVKKTINKLAVIDDLPGRKLFCDILIDQNLGRKSAHYLPFTEGNTKFLLGSKFVLMRNEFRLNKERAFKRRKEFKGLKSILLTLGGSESLENYLKIIKVLSELKLDSFSEVKLALGFDQQQETFSKHFLKSKKLKISVLENPLNIYESMVTSDLCIGYAGSSSWERCVLGLPSLVKVINDNQIFVAKNLEKKGAARIWKKESELKKLVEIMDDRDKWFEIVNASRKICDGNGSRRVANAILE